MYDVIFETGSLRGKSWHLPDGGSLTIGRSHTCAIRPTEPDVSGRHVVLAAMGGKVWLEAVSAHKTSVDGVRLASGDRRELTARSAVSLGNVLAFRIREADGEAETDTSVFNTSNRATEGATATVATVATRAAAAATATVATRAAADGETEIFGSETATGAGPGQTVATAATRAAETQMFTDLSAVPSGQGDTGLATGEVHDEDETQMLATQVASREELEKLKAAYEQKKTRKTAKKTILFGMLVAIAAAVSIWFSSREPEKWLAIPEPRAGTEIVPAILAGSEKPTAGLVGIALPVAGTKIVKKGDGVFEAVAPIGRKGDVPVSLVFEVFSDPAALREDRTKTFDRYLETSEAMLPALDEMAPLPEEDFFGGNNGLRRGIPCSRREYWCGRNGKSIYGVISFFRCGTLCFAFRREVAAYERARALDTLLPTAAWLFADSGGEFAARQWEGADGAGTKSPAAEVARCEERLRVDSTIDWQTIEAGLRNVLVAVDGKTEDANLRDRALGLLGELRNAKATHWQKLTARRAPIANSNAEQIEAREIDAIVRKDFGSPDEEWYFLARRREWWK